MSLPAATAWGFGCGRAFGSLNGGFVFWTDPTQSKAAAGQWVPTLPSKEGSEHNIKRRPAGASASGTASQSRGCLSCFWHTWGAVLLLASQRSFQSTQRRKHGPMICDPKEKQQKTRRWSPLYSSQAPRLVETFLFSTWHDHTI